MDREGIKARREIEIFKKFVSQSGLEVVESSIEHRDPPEPDIQCIVQGEGTVRFELTEACAPEFAEAINNPRPSVHSCFGEDVTKDTILKKLGKSYPVKEPIYLLVYTDGGTAKSDSHLGYDITDALIEKKGQFCKIWLMGDGIHEYSVPSSCCT